MEERQITADQYRARTIGAYAEAWVMIDSGRVRLDVRGAETAPNVGKHRMVELDTERGPLVVPHDRIVYVR